MLSYGAWQRRFGGDRRIIGQAITADRQKCTVAGVLPPRFRFPNGPEMWVPLALNPADATRDYHWLTRLLATMLYNVTPTDPATFAAVSLLLLGIATLATCAPARRAGQVDPVVALRWE